MTIRDEEGFLSEWLAYYTMHGITHFTIFDDGSTDNFKEEIKPWQDRGMVTLVSNWTIDSLNMSYAFRKNDFKRAMATKNLLEANCKLEAIRNNFDFFISLDLDEYLIPVQEDITIADALLHWVNTTGRSMYCVAKNNFPSLPHILEPVNLLTIEAYQTRVPATGRMNYYTSVAAKCAFQLNGPHFDSNTSYYVAECCNFHGCQGHDVRLHNFCSQHHKNQYWTHLAGKGKPYLETFIINHYSRSLEKFALKSKTWATATGEVKQGESGEQAAKSYDLPKFFARSVGWQVDRVALRYSCQVRETLALFTGNAIYLRPGTGWYRNPEFGRQISDPDKRGRYGRPNPPNFKVNMVNPYHYIGGSKFRLDDSPGQ